MKQFFEELQKIAKTQENFILAGNKHNWTFTIFDKGGIQFWWNSDGDKMMLGEGSQIFFLDNWYASNKDFEERHPIIYKNRTDFRNNRKGEGFKNIA